jgi:hypothetical protein
MKLVSDAKAYSEDRNLLGFVLLGVSVLILFVFPLFLIAAPPQGLSGFQPALVAEAAGSIVVLFALALFLKGKGLILKVPLRVYEEGVLIQKAMSSVPEIVPFRNVSSIEFFLSPAGAGCLVISLDGNYRSVENFTGAARIKEFVLSVGPALALAGFAKSVEENGGSFRASFRKSLVTSALSRAPSS